MTKYWTIAVIIAATLAIAACGASTPAAQTPQQDSADQDNAAAADSAEDHGAPVADSADLKAPGTAVVGDATTCPVSGETFTVAEDSPKAEYEGATYYFCCPGCAKKFSEDPTKFLAP